MAAGLSNADFRRLLATPRPGGGGAGGGGGEGEDKQKKHKKPKPFKPGGKLGVKEGEEEDGDKYRCVGRVGRWVDCQGPRCGACVAAAVERRAMLVACDACAPACLCFLPAAA